MSKAKLISFIKADEETAGEILCGIIEREGYKGLQRVVLLGLKEQDRDTRHGCAEECVVKGPKEDHLSIISKAFHDVCMNYKDKKLSKIKI